MNRIIVILFLFFSFSSFAQDNNTPVSFTLGDRDRLMRNEQKIENVRTEISGLRTEMKVRFESIEKEMNVRFDAVNARIDDMRDQMGFMTTLLMFTLGGIMSLIGFVIYDRRTAIKPIQRRQNDLEDVLVEYSKKDPKLRDILKNAGIL